MLIENINVDFEKKNKKTIKLETELNSLARLFLGFFFFIFNRLFYI